VNEGRRRPPTSLYVECIFVTLQTSGVHALLMASFHLFSQDYKAASNFFANLRVCLLLPCTWVETARRPVCLLLPCTWVETARRPIQGLFLM